ncbi:hypothetical protein [Methylobacterium sp. GC_Met_2]|uniref:hypothetical protein n=1 Tax=Methylobacterium sp. GC_Met_2 TaxID=2937376 RepID=UPI00226B9218|nr:hypothetical protein [Methylobacterium sp. GC_Met_2]
MRRSIDGSAITGKPLGVGDCLIEAGGLTSLAWTRNPALTEIRFGAGARQSRRALATVSITAKGILEAPEKHARSMGAQQGRFRQRAGLNNIVCRLRTAPAFIFSDLFHEQFVVNSNLMNM